MLAEAPGYAQLLLLPLDRMLRGLQASEHGVKLLPGTSPLDVKRLPPCVASHKAFGIPLFWFLPFVPSLYKSRFLKSLSVLVIGLFVSCDSTMSQKAFSTFGWKL